jgi:hypothetical protein
MDSSNTSSGSGGNRKGTMMSRISKLRALGQTIHVEFMANGEAIGENGSMFRSYLGVLTRSKILITFKNWKNVPDELKDLIWDDVEVNIYLY